MYLNEEEVGRAIWKKIANGTVRREDIFYTSKVLHTVTSVLVSCIVSWQISLLTGLIFIHSDLAPKKAG